MSQSRQLAAIMFTDIVGYTALMGSNEQKAFELLNKNRQIQKPIIEKFHGRWIKELGDGVMASFSTVTDAVLCASEIQNACEAIDGLKLRIGIHQGEVIFEDSDVFGDTVNIASRLQALAPIGGIWISESVYKNVSNNSQVRTKFVHEEVLKNVKEPVRVYEVLTKDVIRISDATVKNKEPEPVRKSVAVLPFVNMSNDPEQEYFSDGVAEEILNSLAHIKDLKVAGRTSSFQFKGKNIDLREMGEKLGVSTVLEGSVRKQGSRVRITSQLINVADGFHLWSEKFDRQMDDIFVIQDEIALAITENLKVILLDEEKAAISSVFTENQRAYELYLRGKYEWGKRNKHGFLKSIDYFNEAIAEDPQYSLAYAGAADSYSLLCAYHILSPDASIPAAKKAADRAMRLHPMLAEAHEAVGHIDLLEGREWKKAEQHYLKAIELNPGFSTARQRHALILATTGKFTEALTEIEKAVELDPLSKIISTDSALIHYIMGDYDLAIKKSRKVLEMDPAFSVALLVQGLALQQLGEREAAQASFRKESSVSSSTIAKAALASAIAKEDPDGALKLLSELKSNSAEQFVSPYSIAAIYAALGNADEVFNWLNKAVEENSAWIIHLHFSADPRLHEYKSDERYAKLLQRITLKNGA